MHGKVRLGAFVFVLAALGAGCVPVTGWPDANGDGVGTDGLCSGKVGIPGLTAHEVTVGGKVRTFWVYVPEWIDPDDPVPVVFAHHGHSNTGEYMRNLTDLDDVADRERFIAVFPDGYYWSWDAGEDVCGNGNIGDGQQDDIGFVQAMLEEIESSQCVGRDSVFVAGFSMGGYFANNIGCVEGDHLRGIAAHSAGTYAGDCDGAPVPVLLLHGTDDGNIDLECGTGARDLWVERNGCSTEFDTIPVEGGHCERHRGCPSGGQVTLCLFDGMGHGWAGAPKTGPEVEGTALSAGGDEYESASELIWQFFEEQL